MVRRAIFATLSSHSIAGEHQGRRLPQVEEQLLTGGNSTEVVRVGDTVRRTAGPWTGSVRRLLTALRSAGIAEVPQHLGLDDQGREMLTYLPGEVPLYPLPSWLFAPAIIRESGALLRRMHDASVTLVGQPALWQLPTHQPVEVICHNDVAPYNMVFQDQHLRGLIDFDTASPGPRVWDLAYLAYQLVPLTGSERDTPPETALRLTRLDLLMDAYGQYFPPAQVLGVVIERLRELAALTDRRADETGRRDLLDQAATYQRDALTVRALSTSLQAGP